MVSKNDKKSITFHWLLDHMDGREILKKVLKNKLEKKYKIDEFKSLYTFYYSGLNIRSRFLPEYWNKTA